MRCEAEGLAAIGATRWVDAFGKGRSRRRPGEWVPALHFDWLNGVRQLGFLMSSTSKLGWFSPRSAASWHATRRPVQYGRFGVVRTSKVSADLMVLPGFRTRQPLPAAHRALVAANDNRDLIHRKMRCGQPKKIKYYKNLSGEELELSELWTIGHYCTVKLKYRSVDPTRVRF